MERNRKRKIRIENKNKSCGKKVNKRDQRRVGMARTEESRAEFFPHRNLQFLYSKVIGIHTYLPMYNRNKEAP